MLDLLADQAKRRIEIEVMPLAVGALGIIDFKSSVIELHFSACTALRLQCLNKFRSLFSVTARPAGRAVAVRINIVRVVRMVRIEGLLSLQSI